MKKIKKVLLSLMIASVVLTLPVACGDKTPKYSLTFDTNGAATIANVSVASGETYTLPVPTREGYEFVGWYLNADMSGKEVTSVTITEETTVYAKWIKIGTVTLDSNGGTLSVNTVTVKEGENIYAKVKDLVPTKGGLTFGAWFNGDAAIAEDAVMGTTDVTLTAKYIVGYSVDVYIQNVEKTGYEMKESIIDSAYVGSKYVPNVTMPGFEEVANENAKTEGTLTENESENVFSHYFDRVTITLTFDPNYPDGKTAEPLTLGDVTYGSEVEVPCDFETDGYCLVGWSTVKNGSVEYASNYIYDRLYNKNAGETAPGSAADFAQSATLYGVWARAYTDMFGGGDSVYVIDGTAYMERSGVFFRGEYDEETDMFLFIGEDDLTRVKGKLNDDRTFVYSDRERANKSAVLFVLGKGVDSNTRIYFDEYNGLTYSVSGEDGKASISKGYYTIENDLYTVIFEEGEMVGSLFTFKMGQANSNGAQVPAFQIRDEEEMRMGIIARAMLREDGSLAVLLDSYYSFKLDGFGVAVFTVDKQTSNYYYTLDKEKMLLSLRDTNMSSVGEMAVTTHNGKYIWMPYSKDYDREVVVGNEKLTTDGSCNATYTDGKVNVTGTYVIGDSVFGYLVTLYSGSDVYKFLVTSTVIEVATGEGEEQKTEKVTTYSFTKKPASYGEYYYNDATGTYRLPYIVIDEEAVGKASLYGYTVEKKYEKVSSGRYVKNQGQYTYTPEEVYLDNIVEITPKTDENGVVTEYSYYINDASTGEKKEWMRSKVDILNLKAVVFSLDTENTDYSVNYWMSYTPNDGEAVICTERYTAEDGSSITLVGGFAQYNSGEKTIVGSFTPNKAGYYVLLSGSERHYFEINEDNSTFIKLDYAPVTARELLMNGSTTSAVKLSLDGKGGAVLSVTEGTGEEAVTTETKGTVAETGLNSAFGDKVMVFREVGGEGETFQFLLISVTNGVYFSREKTQYQGEYTCGETTLVLDGYFYKASYTDENGKESNGIYYLNDDGAIVLYLDGSANIFLDIKEDKTFTKRGSEYGSHMVINNQTNGGMAIKADGYGKLSLSVIAPNEQGEYVTTVVDDDVDYTIDGNICTFTYQSGHGEITLTGSFGIYVVGSTSYRAFYVLNEETVISLVNVNDWSVLEMNGYGTAIRYAQNGSRELGTYMLITDNILYYVNTAGTDASIYSYDLANGTMVPVKFEAFGYYTSELESLVFTKYGFAIFNGETRYYYNIVDGVCYIYHQEFDENGLIPQETNKFGFIEEVFGEFSAQKEYNGKLYYKDDGVALNFKRKTETENNYKIPLSVGNNQIEHKNIGAITFTPSGGEEFVVRGQVQLDDQYITAYIVRDMVDDKMETYIRIPLSVGYYRLDITVNYMGGSNQNTYEITSMTRVIELNSYMYMQTYYYYAMLFGQTMAQAMPNNYGEMQIVYEYNVEGQESNSYITAEFGKESKIVDINGNIVTFEKATFEQEGNVYVADINVNNGDSETPDNYNYRLHFGLQYMSQLKAYGYVVVAFTRAQTFETENGYTVEVERVIVSETGMSKGYVGSIKLYQGEKEIVYDIRLMSDGYWYCVARTVEEDKIVATKYYGVVLNEMTNEVHEGEAVIVMPYASANVIVKEVETVYADNGADYVDIDADNKVMLMYIGKTYHVITETTYDASTTTYTVTTAMGKKFTVKVNSSDAGKTVVVTEIVEEEDAE